MLDANPLLPSPDVPKALPDQQTIVSTLAVSGQAGPLVDVEVQVNITHTWDSDLDVYLISPSGTRVELFTDVGSSGDNFTDTLLDDQAGVGIVSGAAPFAGSYRPEGSLSALVGQDPNGIWQLEITDDAGGDTGTLHGWALRITTTATAPEVVVTGNGISIADGDTIPGASDHTDFGTIVQASPTVSRTFAVHNSGSATLMLGAVTVPAGFTLTEGLSGSLAPGASDTLTVRLDNATVGTKSGDVSFSTNDGNENPFNFRITGTVLAAAAPEVEVTGNGQTIADGDTTPGATDHTDFGTIVQASPTVSRTFTVYNNGSATLILGPVTVPAGFTLTEGLSGSLAPGASDTFTVRLDNATVGTKSGDISFSTDDADENPFNFRITGVVTAVAANLALGKTAVASTTYSGLPASNVTDGNPASRWSSQFSDSEWIYVDLGSVHTIHRIVLQWEVAYGRGYRLQVSNDASTWSDVYSTTTGDGGMDDITLSAPASGRYVRMLGTQRASVYGYSLWELEVYGAGGAAPEIAVLGNGVSIADGDGTPSTADGTDFGSVVEGGTAISRTFTVRNDGSAPLALGAVTVPAGFTVTEGLSGSLAAGASDTFTIQLDTAVPGVKSGDVSFATDDPDEAPFNFRITGTVTAVSANLALGRPAVASTSYSGYPASNATDGNTASRWSSQFSDNEWIYVDLGSVYTINRVVLRWETAFGRGYRLQVSNDASTWSDVYSTTTGDGGVDDITPSVPASGRYVRMLGTQRATMYGYSLWELEVYGAGGAAPEIAVQGNGILIADGDTTPSATDHTDFGTIVQAGPTVSRTFTVYNSGSATLTLGAVTVPTGFTLTEGLSGSLAPGASGTFTVRLDNATVGTKSGDVSFSTNDGDENPFNFRITGIVTPAAAPEIEVMGNGISIADGDTTPSVGDHTDFGTIVQASPTVSRTFTVYNGGSATLTLGAVMVPAGFTLTEGLSGSLAPGASDAFTVRLDNATVGTKSGDVSFSTNDGDENPFNFRITGTVLAAAAPEIEVTGNGISIADGDATPSATDHTDFGTILQAGPTISRTFTVYNSGSATLTLGAVMVPAGFTLTEGLSGSLAPGASDMFTVRLDNATVGTKSGDVSFSTDDADENPFSFRITGIVVTAAAPEVEVAGNGISIADGDTTPSATDHTDFGTILQAGPTVSRTFTVYNSGSATLTLGAVTVPAGFTLTEGLSGSLAPGASDTFTVRLDNATVGTKSGDISFSTDDADENPFNFRITGTVLAAAPEIAVMGNGISIADGDVTPSTADHTDFGSVPVGSTVVRTFTITNSGSGALHLTGNPAVELLGSGGAFLVVQQPNTWISAGGSTTFQIAYTPTATGLNGATVQIANDDSNENPYDFVIQGTGVQDQTVWVASADAPKALQDLQTIVSTLAVSGRSGSILDVEVQVNITHTWDSDLDVYLISPSGTRVELFTDVGSSGDNFTDTILDDQAGVGIASGAAPFSGSYRPEGLLSALVGQDPNGTWRLEITDDAGGDTGTLNGWALRITTTAAAPEIEVTGNGISIADGDITPNATDHTDLGTIVQAGPTISRTFTVHNSGSATLTLGAVTVPAGFTLTEGLSGSLAPGASDTFTVRLDNATVGTKSGDVSFSTNDGNENPFNFRITGIVAAVAVPEIAVTGNGQTVADGDVTPSAADHTDFGSAPVGSTVVRTFTITNSGSGALHLTGSPLVELLGSGGAFVVVQQPSVLVSAGGSTTLQIAYTPIGTGLNGATVRIANDDSNENPYDFVIQGTGVQDQVVWVASADAPKAILDQQTIVSTLTVSGRTGPVLDVEVKVHITHTWDTDLDVYLISPSGTRVELFTDVGSSGDNFTDTVLDDQAGVGIASGAAPFSGTYRPEGSLSALVGQDPNGTWQLEITDDAGGDTGTLNGWALRITTAAPQPQSVPYEQFFAAGKPGMAEGWEYYSSTEGRIEVVAGRLRMDDTLANTTSSLNEAILHVNLTGKTNVQLVLDHWSLSDENTPLATSFTGHYNGDGIALSVDGVHWVKVTDLTGSFTGQSFALDSMLQQAQVAAGSTDLSDVRIKFQQFDDYPSPDDGREFDNIRILTA